MGLFGLGKTPGLGIDINTDAVKALELLPQGDSYQITRVAELPLPKNLITDDEITDIEQLSKTLQQLRKKTGSSQRDVVAAVSGSQAISKQIAVGNELDDDAIAEKIESEAEALIPFPIAEVRYDFESLGEHPTLTNQQRILVTATRTVSVDSRVEALEQAGFKVKIMDVDSQAILRSCNYLLPHMAPEMLENSLPVLVLDISVTAIHTIVIAQGEVTFSRFQSGGLQPLLKALDEEENGDGEGSEAHREILARLRAGEIDDNTSLVIHDALTNLWSQVNRGIQIYQSSAPKKGFAGVVLVNTGGMLPVLKDFIDQQIDQPVLSLNPFDHFELADSYSHLRAHGPRFVEVLGLALRSFTPWHT
ncbi:type IV pilus assembly protein PilM [Pseudidiomarina sp.]|uniref:type IV pilus assembly protein PilM n=1 Tax=Pseudidiomarina sp. TaxID=2081707 RepID=UPI00299CE279|nr:type IV pilus assembly protein PilM [Pseudidiomarina sp.]MDX1706042.1 type IV pilus assembly protein PilM [Pseudidiomarina sp.]